MNIVHLECSSLLRCYRNSQGVGVFAMFGTGVAEYQITHRSRLSRTGYRVGNLFRIKRIAQPGNGCRVRSASFFPVDSQNRAGCGGQRAGRVTKDAAAAVLHGEFSYDLVLYPPIIRTRAFERCLPIRTLGALAKDTAPALTGAVGATGCSVGHRGVYADTGCRIAGIRGTDIVVIADLGCEDAPF